jgi:hypothetical protein
MHGACVVVTVMLQSGCSAQHGLECYVTKKKKLKTQTYPGFTLAV